MADLPVCQFGDRCYRKNPEHFRTYAHPWLNADAPDSGASDAKKAKPVPAEGTFPPLASRNAGMTPYLGPWESGDYGSGSPPYTVIEQGMMQASGAIRDKPGWQAKVGDASITNKWRSELAAQGMHPTQIMYVLHELAYLAVQRPTLSPVDGVFQSDVCIDEALRQALMQHVVPLEKKQPVDYHPGSHNQVVNLVHPSLYPLVQGVTRIVTDENLPWDQFIGGGRVLTVELRQNQRFSSSCSKKFQWLPSEVSVAADGSSVKFDSYINNLHPEQHKPLYGTLELCLQRMLPLFESVLTDLASPRPRRVHVAMDEDSLYPDAPKVDFSEPAHDEMYDEWRENREPVVNQEIGPFDPTQLQSKLAPVSLKGRKLQVICKLATIELSPEQPDYKGGSWHVEGMENEAIVATGIYYYSSDNISESRLAFRTDVCEPDYEQNDNDGVAAVFNLHNDAPLCQRLGSITCQQGRVVCWPNTLQHQVQNFSLVDKTRPGHRKILVFFLVDPAVRVLSTAFVPPQNVDWMIDYCIKNKPIPGMSHDLQAKIVAEGWHFPHEDALAYRLDLMNERSAFTATNTNERFERHFSLCEH